MIYVIAKVEVAPGKRAEFLTAFRANVPNVTAEAGCLEYGPAVDVDTGLEAQPGVRDNVVTVVEKWQDLEALRVHLGAPHMLSFREQVGAIVQSVELQIMEPA